ncbi:MAG: hypothetical protein HUU50_21585 [Candidatus Brocadiae bacterium]|nr:hypothetical protein [Candidatus Brocadiia bacterium]
MNHSFFWKERKEQDNKLIEKAIKRIQKKKEEKTCLNANSYSMHAPKTHTIVIITNKNIVNFRDANFLIKSIQTSLGSKLAVALDSLKYTRISCLGQAETKKVLITNEKNIQIARMKFL